MHEDVNTVAGRGLRRYTREPFLEDGRIAWRDGPAKSLDENILRPVSNPFSPEGGLRVMEGNLGRGVMKVSAVAAEHQVVEAPARVFHDQQALADAFAAGELERDMVAVMRFQAALQRHARAAQDDPFLGVLQDRGFKVALVTDGRMSGASGKIPAAIHVCPEAYDGGPLARVRDGDIIRVDGRAGTCGCWWMPMRSPPANRRRSSTTPRSVVAARCSPSCGPPSARRSRGERLYIQPGEPEVKLALVGDIGGTNARFALWRDERLEAVKVLATADFATPELAIQHYLAGLGLGLAPGAVAAVCLACAGPVGGEDFRFTNNHWRLNRRTFCEALSVERLLLINDFSAMALGMTRLQPGERMTICEGEAETDRPAVVIGAGTGLGVGTLLPLGEGRWAALPGEGGHVDLPIGSVREAELWRYLHERQGHVSAENILSGGGLLQLYVPAAPSTASSRTWTARPPSPRRRSPATARLRRCWSSSASGSAASPATTC